MSNHSMPILDYAHLITTRPHDIRQIVISDLHLSINEPALVQAFLALLDDLIALPNLTTLFILGDWFDVWIGDDAYLSLAQNHRKQHWLTPIIQRLQQLSLRHCQILIMHGNRDFLIGQAFCDIFNGQLINEPYFIHIGYKRYRLEHGDALCVDDVTYQRFRRVIRNPFVKWLLLKRPLTKRIKLASTIRKKSVSGKAAKSQVIMDVNENAVKLALKDADALLHGHTHRPAIHRLFNNGFKEQPEHTKEMRYVLGDWRVLNARHSPSKVEAVIGITTSNQAGENFCLAKFTH